MSAIAMDLLERLRRNGMEEAPARQIAKAVDERVEEALSEAKHHADSIVDDSEKKAKEQFVSAEEYRAREKSLATREDLLNAKAELKADNAETKAELKSDIAELRAEISALKVSVAHNSRVNYLVLAAVVAAAVKIIFFGGL